MTVKRIGLALLVAFSLLFAGPTAPASAAPITQTAPIVAQLDPPPTCVYVPGNDFRFYDSFHCQTPPNPFQFGGVDAGDVGQCYVLTAFQDGSHPGPNGWGNAISSLKNISAFKLWVYDTANCGGATLFAMDPYTMRATLVAAANNKASSFMFHYA